MKTFLGEGRVNGSVIAIKTHMTGDIPNDKFERAIVLVRHPAGALLSEFNRQHSQGEDHVGHASDIAFRTGKYNILFM